ncbi:hypothetical protein B0H12DRAFT_1263708 [Mycena haematopus]|nr:hypothetical protein B0H12DRAFT_1263708 [Mycena haematopus]
MACCFAWRLAKDLLLARTKSLTVVAPSTTMFAMEGGKAFADSLTLQTGCSLAYTVTNQIVNTFVNFCPPRRRVVSHDAQGELERDKEKKRAVFEDEKEKRSASSWSGCARSWRSPTPSTSCSATTYSEMTIWPLAPAGIRIRRVQDYRAPPATHPVTDRHHRPLARHLSFLTRLAALTNSALLYLYLFCPRGQNYCSTVPEHAAQGAAVHVRRRPYATRSSARARRGDARAAGDGAAHRARGVARIHSVPAYEGHVMEKALRRASEEIFGTTDSDVVGVSERRIDAGEVTVLDAEADAEVPEQSAGDADTEEG